MSIVELYSATKYSVFAATTVTNTGYTLVNGNLGVSPGTAVTGSPTIVNGSMEAGSINASIAHYDITNAYIKMSKQVITDEVSGNLGGKTLYPGVYNSTDGLEISSGDLILDGQNQLSPIFVFRMATTLYLSEDRKIFLINGASAANVFWQVGSSATFATTSVIVGTVMAYASISLFTGSTINGRVFALNGAVTMDSNTINN
jgi:hypothetical protein